MCYMTTHMSKRTCTKGSMAPSPGGIETPCMEYLIQRLDNILESTNALLRLFTEFLDGTKEEDSPTQELSESLE